MDRPRLLVRQEGQHQAGTSGRLPPDGHESARKRPKRDLDPVPAAPQHLEHRPVRRRDASKDLHDGGGLALQGGVRPGHRPALHSFSRSLSEPLQGCPGSEHLISFLHFFRGFQCHPLTNDEFEIVLGGDWILMNIFPI